MKGAETHLDHVELTGYISDKELQAILAAVDICMDPDPLQSAQRRVDVDQDHGIYGLRQTHRLF